MQSNFFDRHPGFSLFLVFVLYLCACALDLPNG